MKNRFYNRSQPLNLEFCNYFLKVETRKIETRIANKLQSFQTVELYLAPMCKKKCMQKKQHSCVVYIMKLLNLKLVKYILDGKGTYQLRLLEIEWG